MKKLIITPAGEQVIDMTQEEIGQRLAEIEAANREEEKRAEKENKKSQAVERLKASKSQDIIDLLEVIVS